MRHLKTALVSLAFWMGATISSVQAFPTPGDSCEKLLGKVAYARQFYDDKKTDLLFKQNYLTDAKEEKLNAQRDIQVNDFRIATEVAKPNPDAGEIATYQKENLSLQHTIDLMDRRIALKQASIIKVTGEKNVAEAKLRTATDRALSKGCDVPNPNVQP